ncbi:MAG: helix-turn-helix transcriptional regulator, partial [Sphingobacterium sp.]
IAARNIASVQTAYPYQPSHPLSMLGYVHQNIKRPGALKIEELASYFHLSPNYVGEYFKKETGESLQKYIRHYRLQMIEAALIHTNRRISEIALDFGFTDTSHLNKMFHQEYGVSPTTFRKRLLEKSGHL